jgi:uncharacterized protein
VTASSQTTDMSYQTLDELLRSVGEIVQLAELHGGICGALAAGGPRAAELWLEDSLDERAADERDGEAIAAGDLPVSLRALMTATWQALDAGEMAFEPLLPEDDAPLEAQVQALALWCHGFLGGLGFAAPDVGASAPAGAAEAPAPVTIAEIVADFAEIARAGVTEEDDRDRSQAEFALAELKEYVRASVQVVFEELDARRAAARDVH